MFPCTGNYNRNWNLNQPCVILPLYAGPCSMELCSRCNVHQHLDGAPCWGDFKRGHGFYGFTSAYADSKESPAAKEGEVGTYWSLFYGHIVRLSHVVIEKFAELMG